MFFTIKSFPTTSFIEVFGGSFHSAQMKNQKTDEFGENNALVVLVVTEEVAMRKLFYFFLCDQDHNLPTALEL